MEESTSSIDERDVDATPNPEKNFPKQWRRNGFFTFVKEFFKYFKEKSKDEPENHLISWNKVLKNM